MHSADCNLISSAYNSMGYFYVKGIISTDKQLRNGTCPLHVRVSVKGKNN